jgi:hypothetical protein
MCFRRSRHWEERSDEAFDERVWHLFNREPERSEPPITVAEQDDERATERDRDKVPVVSDL